VKEYYVAVWSDQFLNVFFLLDKKMCFLLFLSTGNIYDKTLEAVQSLGLDSECVGGGRIKHDAAAKKIHVYGYSQVKFSQHEYSRVRLTDLERFGVVVTIALRMREPEESKCGAVWLCHDSCSSAHA
jgi:hypothetical protein